MLKKWFEEHYKLAGVLLLILAALNGSMAYRIFPGHPIMATANGAVAVVIVLGVTLLRGVGERN